MFQSLAFLIVYLIITIFVIFLVQFCFKLSFFFYISNSTFVYFHVHISPLWSVVDFVFDRFQCYFNLLLCYFRYFARISSEIHINFPESKTVWNTLFCDTFQLTRCDSLILFQLSELLHIWTVYNEKNTIVENYFPSEKRLSFCFLLYSDCLINKTNQTLPITMKSVLYCATRPRLKKYT